MKVKAIRAYIGMLSVSVQYIKLYVVWGKNFMVYDAGQNFFLDSTCLMVKSAECIKMYMQKQYS